MFLIGGLLAVSPSHGWCGGIDLVEGVGIRGLVEIGGAAPKEPGEEVKWDVRGEEARWFRFAAQGLRNIWFKMKTSAEPGGKESVTYIICSSRRCRTKRNVAVGALLGRVLRIYGPPDKIKKKKSGKKGKSEESLAYFYKHDGVAFILKSGVVYAIHIFRKKPSAKNRP